LREYIRHGVGDPGQFLSNCDPVLNRSGPPGHILTAIAHPSSRIVVNMQFFAGCKVALPQWTLVLGENPTVLFVEQVSAHLFAYTEGDNGRFTGGEIVPLRVARLAEEHRTVPSHDGCRFGITLAPDTISVAIAGGWRVGRLRPRRKKSHSPPR
jgi:hypothetical protein